MLYVAAKEREAAERGQFLQEICAGDAALREEVESELGQRAQRTGTSASWLGRHQEAIEQIGMFKQLDPVAPKTHVAAASVYYGAGDYEQTIAASREALDLESHAEPAQYFLGMSQHFAGRSDAAIEVLTRASDDSRFGGRSLVMRAALGPQKVKKGFKDNAGTKDTDTQP